MDFPYKNFFASNARLLLITAIAGIFVYGYELMNFSLSIDEEGLILGSELWFMVVGRFLLYFVEYYIFQNTIVPFVPILISIFLFAISAVIISNFLKYEGWTAITFCILFVSFPSYFYMFQFSFQITAVALGILLSAISSRLFWQAANNNSHIHIPQFVSAVCLLGIALGAYQSILLLPPFIILLKQLGVQIKSRIFQFRIIGWLFLYLAISVALYFCIANIFRWIYGVSSTPYLTQQLGQGLDNIHIFIANIFKGLVSHYTGNSYYGEKLFPFIFLPVIVVAIKIGFAGAWEIRERLTGLGIIAILLILPFTLEFLHGGILSPRVQLCQGLAFAGFWGLAATVSQGKWIDQATILCVGAALLFSAIHCSRLFFTDYLSWESDKIFATQLAYKISSETGLVLNNPENKLSVRGVYNTKIPSRPAGSDIFGFSYFSIGNIQNTQRIVDFMKVNGIASFKPVLEYDLTQTQKEAYSTMALWPHNGCIRIVDGTVLVKLSDHINQ